MKKRTWTVDLGEAAEGDFDGILIWTAENFGPRQAEAYAKLIGAALDALAHDPSAPPSKARDDDIGPGFRTLHLARPGRHFVLYRITGERVRVIRILHDSMELARHLPPE